MTIFKYSELRKFFKYVANHCNVTSLSDWDGSNGLILRHDIDLDIQAAYRLALLEREENICSTFFVLMSCHTYNPLSLENRKMLREMSGMGFEIALHFDPLIYTDFSLEYLQQKVDWEANLLSEIIETSVRSISLHNPSVHEMYPIFAEYNNAYDSRIFSSERYLSDSRMLFKHDVYEFVKKSSSQPIQLLLHPMHYTEEGNNYLEIFSKFIVDSIDRKIDTPFRVNSTYKKAIEATGGNLVQYLSEVLNR
jgi:hypothetical protein